jgi:hypothetical protein
MTRADQLTSLQLINAVRREVVVSGAKCPGPLHDLVAMVRAKREAPLAALVRELLVSLGTQTRYARDSEKFQRGDNAMALLATLVDDWLADRPPLTTRPLQQT